MSRIYGIALLCSSALSLATSLPAQQRGPGGMGRGGPGAMNTERKVLAQFDRDGNKRLDAAERQAALAALGGQSGLGGRGMRGGGDGAVVAVTPGPRVAPADVKSFSSAPFYDLGVVRTIFLTFEDANWEKELMAFNNTDIEVLATMMVDGKTYRDIGVHTRGASSFMMVPEGQKHSLNITMDMVHDSQTVGGVRTLNLLNAHEDPSLLRAALFYQISRNYLPALKANYVHVVINGESWGIYTSVEQFNRDYLKANFGTTGGARWKVPGSPGGQGDLGYLGDDVAAYRAIYEIKSKDEPKAWKDLIDMTKILNQTPPERLEAALAPVLDIDGALRFLALDVALVNNDGFWVRASDYSIYQDPKGKFHVLPADANETFAIGGGGGGRGGRGGGGGAGGQRGGPPNGFGGPPQGQGGPPQGGGFPGGGRGGAGGGGVSLDPLVGLNDAGKSLRSKLLAVPALRTRYLGYVQDIATKWLDWQTLGPIVQKQHDLIGGITRTDTRKLDSTEEFEQSVAGLKSFADQRRAFLLAWKAPQ